MNQKQTDITTGKQIRHLRTQSGMTQEELAGKLNVTRQALSNWERDVNEPDLNTLKKICFLFGVHMDDFAKEVITMSGAGWGASLFGGGCFSLVFGLICHAVITLRRNDK